LYVGKKSVSINIPTSKMRLRFGRPQSCNFPFFYIALEETGHSMRMPMLCDGEECGTGIYHQVAGTMGEITVPSAVNP
jgi:hypothetical protein